MNLSIHQRSNLRPLQQEQRKPEETLKEQTVQVERKTFKISLRANDRGQFLRITEEAGGHRDTIIIPVSGLADFRRALDQVSP